MKSNRLIFILFAAVTEFAAAASAQEIRGMLTPRLSPDGEWIAVSYQGSIAKVRRTGGPLVTVTRDEGWDSDPVWSPDSVQIAYVSAPPGGGDAGALRLVHTQTGGITTFPANVRAAGPLWFHPDGQRLLGRFTSGAAPRLAWINVISGEVTPLKFGALEERISTQRLSAYTLAEDGKSIFFAVHQDRPGQQAGDNGPHADLYRVQADGSDARHILRFRARIYALSVDGQGRGLYAVTDAGVVHNDIWHIPFDAPERGARKLTFGQADEDAPTIDARGQWLVHTDNSRGATRLICHEVNTGLGEPVAIERIDFGQPVGDVRIAVRDRYETTPAARVSIRRWRGKFHAPVDALYRSTAGLMHFYARGDVRLELPEGRYELRVFRGPEYRMHESEFHVRPAATAEVDVSLTRWTNAAARGWYSGENHIHANYGYGAWYVTPQAVFDQCDGEDLRVSNLVVANSDGEAVFDREFFSGRPDAVSVPGRIVYWNQEFRSTLWGHMTLFNLSRLVEPVFTGFRDTTNPFDVPTNAAIAQRARAQNGVASYTHPTNSAHDVFLHAYSAKGLPVDMALGRIDTIDVMGGVYETSLPMWYHALNCGFRIPAAAGTDCFLNRVRSAPPGFGRVYVHVPDALDYQKWVAGLKAGRSFVSNGPMLELSAADKPIGDTLALEAPGTVRVRGRAEWQFPFRSVELIHNGKVVASATMSFDRHVATVDHMLQVERSGWIALRAAAAPATYWHGGDRAAHTNPIYLDVRGQPLDRRASAQYFLKWIDRLEQLLLARDRMDTERAHVLAHLEQAREVYREMLR